MPTEPDFYTITNDNFILAIVSLRVGHEIDFDQSRLFIKRGYGDFVKECYTMLFRNKSLSFVRNSLTPMVLIMSIK